MINPAIIGIVVAVLVSTAFGFFLTSALLPQQLYPRFAWAFAPTAGLGLCSLIFFVFRRPMFTVELAVLVVATTAWLYTRVRPEHYQMISASWRPPMAGLILAGALGFAVTGSLTEVDRMPYGDWDGWAIWNSHARLLYRGGPDWKSDLPYVFHGDYPLLTSGVAARFWRYAGEEVPESGAILGIFASLSAVAVLVLTLREFRDSWLAGLVGLLLVGTPAYMDYAASQYADIPLSFFILSTITLVFLHSEGKPDDPRLLILAGFMAGCAGWTKNEGLLLIVVTTSALLALPMFKGSNLSRSFVPFLAGLLAPLLIIIAFKVAIAPPNDLIDNNGHKAIQRILDLDRHSTILKNVAHTSWSFGEWSIQPMIPFVAFLGLRAVDRKMLRSRGWLMGLTILALMAGGYYFVYLITPIPLQYHLDSSLARLMLQLWPSFLLLLGLTARPRPV